MRSLGSGLLIAGSVAMIVGILGVVSLGLQRLGVPFIFAVSPWYGPFLGGMLLARIGWYLRRRAGAPS